MQSTQLIPALFSDLNSLDAEASSGANLLQNNATAPSGAGVFVSDKIGGFGYGIGVSIGMLVLITTLTLASYFCTRANTAAAAADGAAPAVDVEGGVDEATLKSYPKMRYAQAKVAGISGSAPAAACCSICLSDYKESDVVRVLPECGHVFHLRCVDPWLRLRPTCPLCRTSPLPSPLPSPLAEVVPLSGEGRHG
ncbi:hypothetical protein ZIOFF_053327 [Zingiber officinale]|uniref:RING-type domain-containing protein n=1 Tax=Zingiber officinale TaxID=94328 RepID=A0A8J5KCV0_ZINOF|nr:hypothetical protein ZIOFF_053327 [Zingiber officinale]